MNYTPPKGFIDQPYFWCFDTDTIADGSTKQNQAVNLPGGFDFIVRRITGLDSALNPTTGKWNFRSGSTARNFASADMSNPSKWADRLMVPEMSYPESGSINFDLYNTLTASVTDGVETIKYGQIAFQGVRRRQGTVVDNYGKSFRRVPYTLRIPVTLDWNYTSTQPVRKFSQEIDNFDFEAHCIYWTIDLPSTANFSVAETVDLILTSRLDAPFPGPYTITFVDPGANNVAMSVSTTGAAITLIHSTDGGGAITSTYATIYAALIGNTDVMALITAVVGGTTGLAFTLTGTTVFTGGLFSAPISAITGSYGAIAKFVLYDFANNGLMPVPMRIEYLNEPLPFGALADYKSGALLPVLLYPKDSAISFDITSLKLASSDSINLYMNVMGMQRIPC
jgi:hypothetical protein